MSDEWFQHPFRFPGNADGPFYTTGHQCKANSRWNSALVWCGDCLACEAPELEAPQLLAPLNEGNYDTYFLRQPDTPEQIEAACRALSVCCVTALRYGGNDSAVIERLGNDPQLCDYMLDEYRTPFLWNDASVLRRNEVRLRPRHWWQFWRWWLRNPRRANQRAS
jgi:hypothetical protein